MSATAAREEIGLYALPQNGGFPHKLSAAEVNTLSLIEPANTDLPDAFAAQDIPNVLYTEELGAVFSATPAQAWAVHDAYNGVDTAREIRVMPKSTSPNVVSFLNKDFARAGAMTSSSPATMQNAFVAAVNTIAPQTPAANMDSAPAPIAA